MKLYEIPSGELQTNFYLLDDGTTCVAVDPASPSCAEVDLQQYGLHVPSAILVTHGHFDHIGGVAACAEKWHCPVYMHEADLSKRTDVSYLHMNWGIDAPQYFEVDHIIRSDETVQIGSMQVQIYCTPGHSAGGVCYHVGKLLFCGDTLFAGSYGRTDFVDSDENALIRSCEKIAQLPDDTTILCGHGPKTVLSIEKTYNPVLDGRL